MAILATIRAKILVGCLALTCLSALLGLHAQWAERELGALALQIYDRSFMGMSYLRSAQLGFAMLPEGPVDQDALASVLDDVAIARDRAMSPAGAAVVVTLADDLARLARAGTTDAPAAGTRAGIQASFEHAVELFAGDGFRYRRTVGQLVSDELARGAAALALTLVAALAITLVLGRMIVPPVRRAVHIAQSIAGGKLDNDIAGVGRGETADLLRALFVMQGSISSALARIRALMADQERTHAGVLAAQHARMEAALDNMNQGLCLFDTAGCLAVANRRFAAMFGPAEPGAGLETVLEACGLGPLGSALLGGDTVELAYEMADGRALAVSQRPVEGGGWVATFDDVTERRQTETRLAHAARHDATTGLPNRLLLNEWLHRSDRPIALIHLGLDRFKSVNEALGQEGGDAVLRLVAERLLTCTGPDDQVARIGGDAFVIVRPGDAPGDGGEAGAGDVAGLARRVARALATAFRVGDQEIALTASLGIAVPGDGGAGGPEALLACAELAMDRAKAEAPGTARFFAPEMDAALQRRRHLELDLRRAVLEKQFELFYQPLLHARGIAGFEALLRWHHPVRGMVSPGEFIPLAEETGLIVPIGAWALHQACHDAAGWPGALKVAVNLSPAQFVGGSVPNEAASALAASGLPAIRLELEITESALLREDETVSATLEALRAQGIRIAMDDFGTGFSSLSYLARFRFDKIKIDQSFVRGMVEQEDCLAIVRAVLGLGRALGIAVNAEGVETPAQRDLLRAEGCRELQGYLFSKPQPVCAVPELLALHGNASLVVADVAA